MFILIRKCNKFEATFYTESGESGPETGVKIGYASFRHPMNVSLGKANFGIGYDMKSGNLDYTIKEGGEDNVVKMD